VLLDVVTGRPLTGSFQLGIGRALIVAGKAIKDELISLGPTMNLFPNLLLCFVSQPPLKMGKEPHPRAAAETRKYGI
jgi:hypothetical protein